MKFATLALIAAPACVDACGDAAALTACATTYAAATPATFCDDLAAWGKCSLGAGCWGTANGGVNGQLLKDTCVLAQEMATDCPKTACDSGTALAPSALLLAAITATLYKSC